MIQESNLDIINLGSKVVMHHIVIVLKSSPFFNNLYKKPTINLKELRQSKKNYVNGRTKKLSQPSVSPICTREKSTQKEMVEEKSLQIEKDPSKSNIASTREYTGTKISMRPRYQALGMRIS